MTPTASGVLFLKVYPVWHSLDGRPEPAGAPQWLAWSSVVRIEPRSDGWCALHTAQWGTYYSLTTDVHAHVEVSPA